MPRHASDRVIRLLESSPQGIVFAPCRLLQLGDPQPKENNDEDQGVHRQSGQHERDDRVQNPNNTEGWT